MQIHNKSGIVGSRRNTEASKATSIQKSVITPAPLHSSTYFCSVSALALLSHGHNGGGTEESEGRRQGGEGLEGGGREREGEGGGGAVTDSATDFLIRHAVSECQCVNL